MVDWKIERIPDQIILPAILMMMVFLFSQGRLDSQHMMAAIIIMVLFAIPVVLGLGFGGGDVRYGVFCALLTGLPGIGWFVLTAALTHLALLLTFRRTQAGFAPAMSVGALVAYGVTA